MIQQMSFLGLVVKDVAAATTYYRDTLGLQVNQQASIPDFYTQFETNGGAVFAVLGGFEKEGIDQPFDTALVVADTDEAYNTWRAAGVEMVSEPTDMPFGRTFLFRTPDGHILRAMTPAAAAN